MKGCELCGSAARMYCESDQASLCWDCDEKVHRANFLVAKHCRSLLCQVCQSPTPWKASGPKLGPTVSICESCFSLHNKGKIGGGEDWEESHAVNDHGNDESIDEDNSDDYDDEDEEEEEEEEEEEDDEDEDEEEEEDGENQVVPWSVTSPLPPVASSSSSEDEISSRFSAGGAAALKRMRENNVDFDSDDEIGFSSSQLGFGRVSNNGGNSMSSYRPLKQTRIDGGGGGELEDHQHHHHHHQQQQHGSSFIIDSLERLQNEMVSNRETASASIIEICKLSRDHSRSF